MKLWILRPEEKLKDNDNPWTPWFDKCFGMVVRAETQKEAREIAHDNASEENRGEFLNKKVANTKQPWLNEKYSTCKILKETGKSGMIMEDVSNA